MQEPRGAEAATEITALLHLWLERLRDDGEVPPELEAAARRATREALRGILKATERDAAEVRRQLRALA